jgi:CheY-like chemotaxis protein
MRSKWFTQTPEKRWQVGDQVKQLISFKELNLMAQWPFRGPFDVIFCRNVVIYFDEPTQAKIWVRYADLLPSGGHLYIGHSERLSGEGKDRFENTAITTYRTQGEDLTTMTARTRVLVVDDSPTMRSLIRAVLRSDPAIEVVGEAADALEARSAIKQLNPDVITLDVEMPNMNGIEFLDKIMKLRPMPVIMVSTLTQRGAEATLAALEIGAFDCIGKPLPGDPQPFAGLAEDRQGGGAFAAPLA